MHGDDHKLSLAELGAELERLKSCGNDAERLGADPLAGRSGTRTAFVAAARRFHPDHHFQRSDEFQALAEEIFMLLSEAERRLRRSMRPGASPRRRRPTTVAVLSVHGDGIENSAQTRETPKAQTSKKSPAPARASKPEKKSAGDVSPALLRRLGIDSSAGPKPPPKQADDIEALYGEALFAMLEDRYDVAAKLFIDLLKKRPQEARYHTALELARGHIARDSGNTQAALEHFHRVCVLDGSCADAISAIQALTALGMDDENRLLDRLLGDGR
jgi:tetratricopeptide (TPR) repeat protein